MLEQVSLLVELRNALLPRLDGVGDDRLKVEFRLDQPGRLVCDLLGLRRNDGKRIPHVADAFTDPDHHRPIINDQTMIMFAGNILSGKDCSNTGQSFGFGDIQPGQESMRDHRTPHPRK